MLTEAIARAGKSHLLTLPVRRWLATKSTRGARGAPSRKSKQEKLVDKEQITDKPTIDSQLITRVARSTSSGNDELKSKVNILTQRVNKILTRDDASNDSTIEEAGKEHAKNLARSFKISANKRVEQMKANIKSTRADVATSSATPATPLGINIFNAEDAPCLGIFQPGQSETSDGVRHYTPTVSVRGPRNGWEELSAMTREGKVWNFPIDNEACMKHEEEVSWTEHVFLNRELDSMGIPAKGAIREFMELVAAGLSKNPYMPIAEKREHLVWFRDTLLKEQEASE